MPPKRNPEDEEPRNMSNTGEPNDPDPEIITKWEDYKDSPTKDYRGIYVLMPGTLSSKNKAVVAGYLGFQTRDEVTTFFSQPSVADIVQSFEKEVANNFGLKSKNTKWRPTGPASREFFNGLEQLGTNQTWCKHFHGIAGLEKLPLKGKDFPEWASGDSENTINTKYAANIIAYVLTFMGATAHKFCHLWQPVRVPAHTDSDYSTEDFFRYWVALRSEFKLETAKELEKLKELEKKKIDGKDVKLRNTSLRPISPKWATPVKKNATSATVKREQTVVDTSYELAQATPQVFHPKLFMDINHLSKAPAVDCDEIWTSDQIILPADKRGSMTQAEMDTLWQMLHQSCIVLREGSSLKVDPKLRETLAKSEGAFQNFMTQVNNDEERMVLANSSNKNVKRPYDELEVQEEAGMRLTRQDNVKNMVNIHHEAWVPQYEVVCDLLGLEISNPMPYPMKPYDYKRLPHQTSCTGWCLNKEKEALGVVIIGDEVGMGKTLECLDIPVAATQLKHKRQLTGKKVEYGITLVLAPTSVFGNWVLDAEKFYPADKRPKIVTFYSKAFKDVDNFTTLSALTAWLNTLDVEDPSTGTVIVVSTYGTWSLSAVELISEVRNERLQQKGIDPRSKRAEHDFEKTDFHIHFAPQISIDRVFLDEGHAIKNPSAARNHSVRFIDAKIYYIISATILSNSIEDVYGITALLKRSLWVPKLGVEESLGERIRCRNPVSLEDYEAWHKKYNSKVQCYNDSRFLPRSHVPENCPQGFWTPGASSASERYGLFLLDDDTIRSVMNAKENRTVDNEVNAQLARSVVGLVLRTISITRTTHTKIRVGTDEDGQDIFVTPGDSIPDALVSTVDILPSPAGDELYQKLYAPLHGIRTRVRKGGVQGSGDENEANLDSGIDRLLSIGAMSPHLGLVGMKMVLARLARRSPDRGALTQEDLVNGSKDRESLRNARYLLPNEAPRYKDNGATWLYMALIDDAQAEIPSSRSQMLQVLSRDAPKANWILKEVEKAKRDGQKIIIFCCWPLTQLYLETLLSLAEIQTISMHRKDSATLRRTKVAEFSRTTCTATAFVVMDKTGAHGMNLHSDCHLMIIADQPSSINMISQMVGRIVRIGQKQSCHIRILVTDRTMDNKRQADNVNKMMLVIAATAAFDIQKMTKEAEEEDTTVNKLLNDSAEERCRILTGAAMSRRHWHVRNTTYTYYNGAGDEDPDITRGKVIWQRIKNKYSECEALYEESLQRIKQDGIGTLWAPQKDYDELGESIKDEETDQKDRSTEDAGQTAREEHIAEDSEDDDGGGGKEAFKREAAQVEKTVNREVTLQEDSTEDEAISSSIEHLSLKPKNEPKPTSKSSSKTKPVTTKSATTKSIAAKSTPSKTATSLGKTKSNRIVKRGSSQVANQSNKRKADTVDGDLPLKRNGKKLKKVESTEVALSAELVLRAKFVLDDSE